MFRFWLNIDVRFVSPLDVTWFTVRFGISRQEQDEFALRSHQNAAKAHADGTYDQEV